MDLERLVVDTSDRGPSLVAAVKTPKGWVLVNPLTAMELNAEYEFPVRWFQPVPEDEQAGAEEFHHG